MFVLNYSASSWRRTCLCSFFASCDKRMVGRYVFSYFKH